MNFLQLFSQNREEALRSISNNPYKNEIVNSSYNDFWTCAHQAARDGDIDSLVVLRDYGANLWSRDDRNEYPLLIAVKEDHYDIVTLILETAIPEYALQHIVSYIRTSLWGKTKDCCFGIAFWFEEKFWIARELRDKFFPLFNDETIRTIVHNALMVSSLEFIKGIFSDNVKALDIIGDSSSLPAVLNIKDVSDIEKLKYVLYSAKSNYPIDISRYMHLYKRWIKHDTKCESLMLLMDHRRKISNVIHPLMLYYAIEYRNMLAVDILLSCGCNTKICADGDKPSCSAYVIYRCFELKNRFDFLILRKLYFYSMHGNPIEWGRRGYSTNPEFMQFVKDIPRFMMNSITLFDLILSRIRIKNIQTRFHVRAIPVNP
jgi:hypothetical protein